MLAGANARRRAIWPGRALVVISATPTSAAAGTAKTVTATQAAAIHLMHLMTGSPEIRPQAPPASTSTCIVAIAAVRAEPDDAAEQVTQALAGEPLTVEERRDGWARIRTAYDYPGWIREDALASGTGTEAGASPYGTTESRDGDPVAEARAYLGAPYEWGGL